MTASLILRNQDQDRSPRGQVVLTGHMRSWRKPDLAERVAWSAPGMTQVRDYVVVQQGTYQVAEHCTA